MSVATPKKRFANRRNAGKSTGPRTAEGKARASLNAIKHGFCARTVVIPGEDPKQYEVLRGGLREDLRPRGMLEEVLVERLAATAWRLRRATTFEAALMEQEMQNEAVRRASNPGRYKDSPPPLLGRYVFCLFKDRDIEAIARHEQRLEKTFFRTLDEIRRCQAARASRPAGAAELLGPELLASVAAPFGETNPGADYSENDDAEGEAPEAAQVAPIDETKPNADYSENGDAADEEPEAAQVASIDETNPDADYSENGDADVEEAAAAQVAPIDETKPDADYSENEEAAAEACEPSEAAEPSPIAETKPGADYSENDWSYVAPEESWWCKTEEERQLYVELHKIL